MSSQKSHEIQHGNQVMEALLSQLKRQTDYGEGILVLLTFNLPGEEADIHSLYMRACTAVQQHLSKAPDGFVHHLAAPFPVPGQDDTFALLISERWRDLDSFLAFQPTLIPLLKQAGVPDLSDQKVAYICTELSRENWGSDSLIRRSGRPERGIY